ncbi:MAG: alpha/beta hydrolase [Allosphingosinicella sp.]|uniref:alpha/beta hydrolase n=1 Tax=Allosphingosinicella sp. TaxID=2823234 RepID=UPI0039580527
MTRRSILLDALPPERSGKGAPAELVERRAQMQAFERIQVSDPAVPATTVTIAGVSCIEVAASESSTTLIFLHGGGYRMGEARTWTGLATRIAAAAGVRVIVPDYRLAPEHPFPAALRDAGAVYDALADPGATLFVGGDSAGGGLACSLVLAALATGAPIPAGVTLISPWLDLVPTAPSFQRCAESDKAFSAAAAADGAAQYLQGQAPDHEFLSPLTADLTDFPPCWIAASASEVLVDQSVSFAQRLTLAQRTHSLCIERDMPHAWPMIVPEAEETTAAIAGIANFIRRNAA